MLGNLKSFNQKNAWKFRASIKIMLGNIKSFNQNNAWKFKELQSK
jgi:hypothetical protein